MRNAAILLLTLGILLGACGNGEPSNGEPPDPTGSPEPTAPASPTATASAATPGAPAPSEPCDPVTGGADTFVQLVDVRVGMHEGFDRIVFEFQPPAGDVPPGSPPDALPRYTLEPVDEVVQDGSGEIVEVAGEQLYTIRFQGASGVDLSGEEAVEVYTGPDELTPGFESLVEAERAGDFEAVLTWGLGVSTKACPTVREFRNPLRVAVDIPS